MKEFKRTNRIVGTYSLVTLLLLFVVFEIFPVWPVALLVLVLLVLPFGFLTVLFIWCEVTRYKRFQERTLDDEQ